MAPLCYRKYFYRTRPQIEKLNYGDISEMIKWKEDNKCKSFNWYMENVAGDVIDKYPLPSPVADNGKRWGILKIKNTKYCVDGRGTTDQNLVVYHCNKNSRRQIFIHTESNELVHYYTPSDEIGHCLVPGDLDVTGAEKRRTGRKQMFSKINIGSNIMLSTCISKKYGIWEYDSKNSMIKFIKNGDNDIKKLLHGEASSENIHLCLALGDTNVKVEDMKDQDIIYGLLSVQKCDSKSDNQKFEFEMAYYEDRS